MKILITGGTGFVGKNLIKKLINKRELFILTRKDIHEKGFYRGDLMDYPSLPPVLKNVDTVVHLAFSKNYPENIAMTKNLVDAAKKRKIKKLILVSSMSAKRNNPDDYGKVKQQVEEIIKKSGLNYTVLRPSIIYGKGSTSFNFIITKLRSIPFFVPIIGNGKYRLSPVHIDDVISSIIACLKNKKTDKKDYDLPGGEEIYFVDLINAIKKNQGINKRNLPIPIWACNIIATLLPKVISKENIKNLTEDSLADISQARTDFKYSPIEFKEGIKDGLL